MVIIDKNSKLPIYRQIYKQLKAAIVSKKLAEGEKIPPIRTLAEDLEIGKNTVNHAYHQLLVEGYIKSVQGSGFVVEDMHKHLIKTSAYKQPAKNIIITNEITDYKKYKYNFSYSELSLDNFPISTWRKYVNQVFLSYDFEDYMSYGNQKGLLGLREEIRKYLFHRRGVSCNVNQIVITTGLQDALGRICMILPEQYRCVGIENPGLPSICSVFNNYDYAIEPIKSEYNNNYFDKLYRSKVRLLLTTPSHQFPMGNNISISERYQLLNWANETDSIIFEDDYDSELRYSSNPLPSIHSIDETDRVIYFGTFSKVFSPAIRLSYLILPLRFLNMYEKVFGEYHTSISWITQKAMELYMKDGQLEKQIRSNCTHYKSICNYMYKCLKETFGNEIKIIASGAGLHMLIIIPAAPSSEWLEQRAGEIGVKVYKLDSYYWDNTEDIPENMVILGFASMNEKQIHDAIVLLKEVWSRRDKGGD